jgi:hypothetical protein
MTTLRRRSGEAGLLLVLQAVAVPLYAVIAAVAAVPELVGAAGFTVAPLQVEGITLVLLILLGTQSAWLVTFAVPAAD